MSIPCIRGHHFDSSLLHSDSVIIDLGGHKGEFSSEVHEKFDCTAFIIEAMPDLYASIIRGVISLNLSQNDVYESGTLGSIEPFKTLDIVVRFESVELVD